MRNAFLFFLCALLGASGAWALWSPAADSGAVQEARPSAPAAQSGPLLRPAGNAHCWCDVTCHGGGGSFARDNSANAPGGYTQGSNADRGQCQSVCNQWIAANIANWASEANICGGLSCGGTSHVGSENQNNYRSISGSHVRTCAATSTGGGCCAPGSSQDVISVFRFVQTTDINDPYRIIYTPSQNPAYDISLQAYADYVGAPLVRPDVHHIWAGYGLVDEANPGAVINWGAVKYIPTRLPIAPVPSFTWGFYIGPPAAPALQVGHTYRVWRGMFFKDAQDRDIAYFGDPGCPAVGFRVTILVMPLRQAPGRPGGFAGQVPMATISVEGQPDRIIGIERESPAERDRRLQLERIPPAMERPRNFSPDAPRRPVPAARQR